VKRRPRTYDYRYIRSYYGVDPIVGARVTVEGKPGTIVREDPGQGNHLMVRFDGDKHAMPCHPTWEVDYLAVVP